MRDNKRIVITGAGGFLGKELLFMGRDLNIVAVSSQKVKVSTNTILIDRNNFFDDFRFMDTDILVNCAFPTYANGTQIADGMEFVKKLLMKAENEAVGGVINISSQSVHGLKRTDIASEISPISLESVYAAGKYATELLTNSLCRNIPHMNIRMASLIGADSGQRVINRMIRKVVRGEDLTVAMNARRFGFLDVRDAAAALLRLVQMLDNGWEETYMLGSGHAYSLKEMADTILNEYKKYNSNGFEIRQVDSDETGNSGVDSSKLYSLLGWKPEYTLADSVSDIMKKEYTEFHGTV